MEQTFIRLIGGTTSMDFRLLYLCEVGFLSFIIFWPSEGILDLATIGRFRVACTEDQGHLKSHFMSVLGMVLHPHDRVQFHAL